MKKYLVGGAVRDRLLKLSIDDRDWVVTGATIEQMQAMGFKKVGKHFPVFLHPKTNEEYALARKEIKTGKGYHGFTFDTAQKVSLVDDLKRRDLTINAIAQDEDGHYIDPFGGIQDIQNKQLRHVSPAFREDPLRVIRVARFAAKFKPLGFKIAPATKVLMRQIVQSGELQTIKGERFYQEFSKAFQTEDINVFFKQLTEVGALQAALFPLSELIETCPEALFAVNMAKQNNISQFEILFAVFISHLNTLIDIQRLADFLKVPNRLYRLSCDLYNFQALFSNLERHSAQAILNAFKKTNAIRNYPYISQLISVCQYRDNFCQKNRQSLANCIDIIRKLSGFPYRSIVTEIKDPTLKSEVVESKQLEIIESSVKTTFV